MQISVSKQIHADLAHQHGFLGEGYWPFPT